MTQTPDTDDRALIPAAVRRWPTVRRETCDGYRSTHDRELLILSRTSTGCSDTQILGGRMLFVSVGPGAAAPQDPSAYDRWGKVDGQEVKVLARGDELRSLGPVLAAWVPATGEQARLLAIPDDVNDANWPYLLP